MNVFVNNEGDMEIVNYYNESLIPYLRSDKIGNTFMAEICETLVLDYKFMFQNIPDGDSISIYGKGPSKNFREHFLLTRALVQFYWPNKKVLLSISGCFGHIGEDAYQHNLFCSNNLTVVSENYEAILTWAGINEISIILEATDFCPSPVSWFRSIPDYNLMPGLLGGLSLSERRGYNTSKMFGRWGQGMKPCVNYLTYVPENGVSFIGEQNFGYLELILYSCNIPGDFMELDIIDVYVALFFAFETFDKIEIQLKSDNQLINLFEAVSAPEFNRSVSLNKLTDKQIFLGIPISVIKNYTYGAYIKKVCSRLNKVDIDINIHLTQTQEQKNSSNVTPFSTVQFTTFWSLTQISFGIEWDNCAEIVSWYSEPVTNTEFEAQILFVKSLNISYIICRMNVDFTKLTEKRVTQEFLMTHLFIKEILQAFIPTINRVVFGLSESTKINAGDKDFLIFLNLMNRFAKDYNMEYILLPVMSTKISGELGWWDISNCSDISLTNHWNQTIQSRYSGKEPEKPKILIDGIKQKSKKFTAQSQNEAWTGNLWLVVGLVVSLIVLMCILGGVIISTRKKSKLLSDEDIKEFIQGRLESSENNSENNDRNLKHVRGKFKVEHELKKTDISLDTRNVIGMGNFGVVYRALLSDWSHRQGTEVAVKMPQIGCVRETFVGMLHEVKLLGYLGEHANIVRFIGAYTKEIQRGVLYIVMDLCSGGSLLSHLKSLKGIQEGSDGQSIQIPDLIRFCREIAFGMEFISSRDVVHGDLAARNVLLGEHRVCKISDFGLSRKLYNYKVYSKKGKEALPWRWMSYESLKKLEFSTMSDVWSFGVTAWEIFSLGDVPFVGLSWTSEFVDNLENGMRLSAPSHVTDEIYCKVATCWEIEPNKRPKFSNLVQFFGDLMPYADLM